MIRLLIVTVAAIAIVTPDARAQARHSLHRAEHGGVLLQLWNDTVHAEAVFSEQRRFRIYLTDAAGSAVPPARLREIGGGVVNDDGRVIGPFAISADGQYLEARIGSTPLPATIGFVLRAADGVEERLGVLFNSYTVEPESFDVPATVIPPTLEGILTALDQQVREAGSLIANGEFGRIYIPTSHIRELLLALQPRVADLPQSDQSRAEAAVIEALRISWLMHVSGDIGLPTQTIEAAKALAPAIAEVLAGFKRPR